MPLRLRCLLRNIRREERRALPSSRPLGCDQCQQVDIENVAAVPFLVGRQRIQEQGRQTGLPQDRTNTLIARTRASAAAAVRENDQPLRVGGQAKQPRESWRLDPLWNEHAPRTTKW